MRSPRVVVELLHIVGGLAAAIVLTAGAAWSYPMGREIIWACGGAAMVATVAMGVTPLRRAVAEDRA